MMGKIYVVLVCILSIFSHGAYSNKLGAIFDNQETGPGLLGDDDVIDFSTLSQLRQESQLERGEEEREERGEEGEELQDPCKDVYCDVGQECTITPKGEGVCQCVTECEHVEDERRKVCSNQNTTWASDCELYKTRCQCLEGAKECHDIDFKHLHIDYYGTCQEVAKCEDMELQDFPRRMREWLFNIMTDMADRHILGGTSMELKQRADKDHKFKWIGAAIWKWCQLDSHPKDMSVSRHEIFPVRAPLHTLEHCISPFLDSCDSNNDHYITLKEWTNCLQLSEDLTEDMEHLCKEIRE